MSARLAQFDALLSRRRLNPRAAAAHTPHILRDPWGEPIAEFSSFPSDLDLLKAAHRVDPGDWIGVLADDARHAGVNPAWRLALLRTDRHGRPRRSPDAGPQWLSMALRSRPGTRPASLRRDLCAAAVRQLWQSGWKLIG